MSRTHIGWMGILTVVTSCFFGLGVCGEEPLKPVKRSEELPVPPAALRIPDTPLQRVIQAHQWCDLGVNGELVAPADYIQVTNDPVFLFLTAEGMELRRSFGIRDMRAIATVDSTGDIHRVEEQIQQMDGKHQYTTPGLPAFPHKWPMLPGSSGIPAMPPPQMILSSKSPAEFQRNYTPEHNLGWILPSSCTGLFIFPVEGAVQPENILWIVPHDPARGAGGGFDFVHSGPLYEGAFMHVAETGEITLDTGAFNVELYVDRENYWAYRDLDTQEFTVDLDGQSIQLLGYDHYTKMNFKAHRFVSGSGR